MEDATDTVAMSVVSYTASREGMVLHWPTRFFNLYLKKWATRVLACSHWPSCIALADGLPCGWSLYIGTRLNMSVVTLTSNMAARLTGRVTSNTVT